MAAPLDSIAPQLLIAGHAKMVADQIRVSVYARAIRDQVSPGDVVLDLGTGTGIMSIFAARAGATVYAVDADAGILAIAGELAKANHVDDRITFIHASFEDVVLPQPVDVILHELFGSFAIDEGVSAFVPEAKAKWLRPEGRLIPAGFCVHAAPATGAAAGALQRIEAEHALDLSPLQRSARAAWGLREVSTEQLLAPAKAVFACEFDETPSRILDFGAKWTTTQAGQMSGIACWFDADMGNGELLSTSPAAPKTCWKQGFLPIQESIQLAAGDEVEARIHLTMIERVPILDWTVTTPNGCSSTQNRSQLFGALAAESRRSALSASAKEAP